MKWAIRPVAEAAASVLGPMAWRMRRRPTLIVLAYHRVAPRDGPVWRIEQPSMLVTPETLAMHLQVLREDFELVHLDDWIGLLGSGRQLPRRACAITFDDGWRDNFLYGFPVLQNFGAPATVFLVSDLVGGQYRFWPNRLGSALVSALDRDSLGGWPSRLAAVLLDALPQSSSWPPNPELLDAAIVACKRRFDDHELNAFMDQLPGLLADGGRALLNWEEIAVMSCSGLVRFGSHTRSHLRLSDGVRQDLIEEQVVGSRAAIERQTGKPCLLFCYPNGDSSAAADRLVRTTYQGAVLTDRGWNDDRADVHRLLRIGIHEDVASSRKALLLRLAKPR